VFCESVAAVSASTNRSTGGAECEARGPVEMDRLRAVRDLFACPDLRAMATVSIIAS
jgi:hypothetical protein